MITLFNYIFILNFTDLPGSQYQESTALLLALINPTAKNSSIEKPKEVTDNKQN